MEKVYEHYLNNIVEKNSLQSFLMEFGILENKAEQIINEWSETNV